MTVEGSVPITSQKNLTKTVTISSLMHSSSFIPNCTILIGKDNSLIVTIVFFNTQESLLLFRFLPARQIMISRLEFVFIFCFLLQIKISLLKFIFRPCVFLQIRELSLSIFASLKTRHYDIFFYHYSSRLSPQL